MKFEDSLANKIEMKKVKLDVMKPWISDRVSTLLGMYIYLFYYYNEEKIQQGFNNFSLLKSYFFNKQNDKS